MPFFDHDPTLDHGIVYRAPEAHCSQHIGGAELAAHQLQAAAVHQEQVSALAHSQLADVCPAQQPGAAPGGHFQHLVAGRGRLAAVQPVEQIGHPQFLHEGRTVVAGGAVHRQAHRHPQSQHFRHPGHAGGKLHIADGAVGHAGAGAGQLPQFLVIEMDAVGKPDVGAGPA